MAFPLQARFAHPEAGWDGDQKLAAEHLKVGEVYTIRQMNVGRSSTEIFLYDMPSQVAFNSVMFDAVLRDEDDEDDESGDQ